MKLLTIAVPCYNAQAYMHHCVETLLEGGHEIEIILVDDGSKDDTPQIADALAAAHPDIIRTIHQENGGHGAAVMTGLRNASGRYFKVVDSDDWVDGKALLRILDTLRQYARDAGGIDLLVSNYVYDKVGVKKKHVVRYHTAFPIDQVFCWDDVKHFRVGQYILMHAAIYRTELLRTCGLDLPRHTFYVDNLYVYVPMQAVERLYYLDVDFYHYYIGREDQSVNEQVMIGRIDQQIFINKLMVEQVDLASTLPVRKRRCMLNYMEIVTAISSILLITSGTPENLKRKDELWRFIAKENPWLYHRIRFRPMGQILHLPGHTGRKFATGIYRLSQKVIGFS